MVDSTLTSWATDEWPAYTPDLILPGLYQGGTEDDAVIGYPVPANHYTRMNRSTSFDPGFDVIVTLYGDAQPAPWGVQEIRFGFPDGPLRQNDIDRVVAIAHNAYELWQSGNRTLIRCQAGVNRSGLVTVLILMIAGYTAIDAIDLVRSQRSCFVLSNSNFENWLLTEAHTYICSNPDSSKAA